jgi:hypothetical protein
VPVDASRYKAGQSSMTALLIQQKRCLTSSQGFGCRPYPMPFVRTKELVGFQRWVIGAYDKRFSWEHWQAADYRPEKLHLVGHVNQDN